MTSVATVGDLGSRGTAMPPRGPNPSRRMIWRHNANLAGLLFLLPAAVVILGLLGYPLGLGIWLSLTNQTVGQTGHFVGLANFENLVSDPVFRTAAFNTVLYTVVSIIFKYILGMILALLLNKRFRLSGLVRGLVLLPWVAPTVLTAMAWWWIFDPQFSVLSWGLEQVGIIHHNIDFLGAAWNARWSIIGVDIWRGTPFFAISFLAGLQTIPKTLYEAADMDGASPWQRFRHVVVPQLSGITAIVVTFSAIFTFSDFALVYVITHGGPENATQLLATLAYQRGITGGNLSQGAAIAIYIVPILFVVTLISYFKVSRRKW